MRRWKPRGIVINAGAGRFNIKAPRPRVLRRTAFNPDESVGKQLAALAYNLQNLDDEVGKLDQEVLRVADQAAERLEAEAEGRASDKEKIREELASAVAGNLRPLAFGLVWLAIGVAIATFPAEIVQCRRGKWVEVFHFLSPQ